MIESAALNLQIGGVFGGVEATLLFGLLVTSTVTGSLDVSLELRSFFAETSLGVVSLSTVLDLVFFVPVLGVALLSLPAGNFD